MTVASVVHRPGLAKLLSLSEFTKHLDERTRTVKFESAGIDAFVLKDGSVVVVDKRRTDRCTVYCDVDYFFPTNARIRA